jgi:hypothetical protein
VTITSLEAPITTMITLQPVALLNAACDLMWSRVPQEFRVKFALSEGGIGWVPYLLERADYVFEHHHTWTGSDFGGKRPSDIFREHFIACFIDDPTGVALRDRIGVENICWEHDYPHSDSTWPNAPESLMKALDGVSDADIAAMTHGNACREFQFDPFAHRAREACTAGALRAEAAHVDVAPVASGRPFEAPTEPVSLMSLLDKAQKILDAASGTKPDPQ